MGIIYPGKLSLRPQLPVLQVIGIISYLLPADNKNRANRVLQLADNIGAIQQALIEISDDIRFNDERTLRALNTIARDAGYDSLKDYTEVAFAKLPEEQKAAYLEATAQLQGVDDSVDMALKVGAGFLAVGIFGRLSGELCYLTWPLTFSLKQSQR
jgi:hypothetical protein